MPWVTRVSEDTAPGSAIVQVKAIDGDHGINAPISYGLTGDSVDHFVIEPSDGTVYLTERLDREHPNVTNGAIVITVIVMFTQYFLLNIINSASSFDQPSCTH